MKKPARKFIEKILWFQVRRLRAKKNLKVVAVAGSLGKTSTKLAIASTLSAKYKVQFQDGNYNVPVSVPLVIFGQSLPSLFNPLAWLRVFFKNELIIRKQYPYDVVILELGTDGPGQLAEFIPRLSADIGVLTAIAPEHMEFFKTLDAVASEELTLVKLSKSFIYNKDHCDPVYTKDITGQSYGIDTPADVKLENIKLEDDGCSFEIHFNKTKIQSFKLDLIAKHQLYAVGAAASVAHQMDMTSEEIEKGINTVTAASGRMQLLSGIKGTKLIDDTYNASPKAMLAALDTLYHMKAPHKVAVLGNMNELGDYSKEAHIQVGEYCDPAKLDAVLTIGPDANTHLAAAAENKGCRVLRFDDPYSIGEHLKASIEDGSLILFKGSQNRVFAEEAIKPLLANPTDESKLVRQSSYWQRRKKKSFGAKK